MSRVKGEEPLDNVTKQYHETMARILIKYGSIEEFKDFTFYIDTTVITKCENNYNYPYVNTVKGIFIKIFLWPYMVIITAL